MLIDVSAKVGAGDALIYTCLGMGVVFVVLILISFVIYLLKFVPALLSGEKKKKKEEIKEATPVAKQEAAPVAVPVVNNDTQIVAVITAAIAAQMEAESGVPVSADGLVIRSIKKRTFSN